MTITAMQIAMRHAAPLGIPRLALSENSFGFITALQHSNTSKHQITSDDVVSKNRACAQRRDSRRYFLFNDNIRHHAHFES